MDAKTLTALKGSIEKWEKIVAGTGLDKLGDNCPLCKLVGREKSDCSSFPCPVYKETKEMDCQGSPYWKWREHYSGNHMDEDECRVFCPTCRKLAQAELDFLKGLLPGSRATSKE
jgi:hypothetical protein